MQASPSESNVYLLESQVVIIGGGIAGLWLLNHLAGKGIDALLLESDTIGGVQTIASQGMIHGGMKYALAGKLSGASEAIADMPAFWRRCLNGEADVDLRHTKLLSDAFYLWSGTSISSRLGSFLGSKASRGRSQNIAKKDYTAPFDHPDFKGSIYKLLDIVLDVPSLLDNLYHNYSEQIFAIDWQNSQWLRDDNGKPSGISLKHDEKTLHINAQQFVLAAGAGNETLCQSLQIQSCPMQLRPLQQVLVKHHHQLPIYGHFTGLNPSPRLTISSHRCQDGDYVWYLGGDLATEGTHLDPDALIANAKSELNDLMPWLDFSHAQYRCIKLDRAEPQVAGLIKPDQAFAKTSAEYDNVIIAWPTKLTLAPDMANKVSDLLTVAPSAGTFKQQLKQCVSLPRPPISPSLWDELFLEQS